MASLGRLAEVVTERYVYEIWALLLTMRRSQQLSPRQSLPAPEMVFSEQADR